MENQWFGAVRGFPMLIDGWCTDVVCQDTVKLGQDNIVITNSRLFAIIVRVKAFPLFIYPSSSYNNILSVDR